MNEPVLPAPVGLTVVRVERNGNTNNGRYFFDFVPDTLIVDTPGTMLMFELSLDTGNEYVIEQMISSDTLGQLGEASIDRGGRVLRVPVRNSVPYLIQMALLLRDRRNNEVVVCDPQVICRPPPHIAGGGA